MTIDQKTNRIDQLFESKKRNILSVYFTAGYPNLTSTGKIAKHLEAAGVDMIEIGIPYFDPVADGTVIQNSNEVALAKGMTIDILLEQVRQLREEVSIPIVLMTYVNPVLQYNFNRFCKVAAASGVDGLIIPDLSIEVYEKHFQECIEFVGLCMSFLIAPTTPYERIKKIDQLSTGFVYAVATSATTGKQVDFQAAQTMYFERLQMMKLKNPFVIGFGISSYRNFHIACKYAAGAIVGSAFIELLNHSTDLEKDIRGFVARMRMSD